MLVKLAPGQPYWMLLDPNTGKPSYYLSFEHPGPIEIQEDSLSQHERDILYAAMRYRLLERADQETSTEAVSPGAAADNIDASYLLDTDPALKAQELLQLNVTKCLEAINDLVKKDQLAVLETMLSMEEQGLNHNGAPRKTILVALDKAIANCAGLTGIVDSEPEEVTISIDTPANN